MYDETNERHKSLTRVVGHPDPKYNFYVTAIEEKTVKDRIMVVGAVKNLKGNKFKVASLSGTSQAAPHISGLAALMLQANPNLTAAQIKRIIKKEENAGYTVGDSKYMPDAEKCVLEALNTAN